MLKSPVKGKLTSVYCYCGITVRRGDDPTYTGMDIHSKIIVCITLDEDGKVVRKDSFENSFDRLNEYISQFHEGDKFVMESTGFYESL